jgi:hypothetical protein
MKKFVFVLLSISLIAVFSTTKNVKVSTVSNDVAYNEINHPIQPPIG